MLRKFLIFIIIITLLGILGWYYLYTETHKSDVIKLYGNVDVRQVDLGFRVSGRVNTMLFQEGDLIPEGTLLGTLDQEPYLDEVRQTEATIESIQASLKNAEISLKRRLELIEDGSVSQEDLDAALTNKSVLEANLKNAKASLAIAQTNLQFTQVFAPTEGTILSRIREPGAVVKAGDPIYTLSITSPVWVRAFIPEPFLGTVFPGMKAVIHTDTKDGPTYTGHVGFISPIAEFTPKTVETAQLRTDLVYRLRIYAENPDKGLRQGMPVTVILQTHEPKPTDDTSNNSPQLPLEEKP